MTAFDASTSICNKLCSNSCINYQFYSGQSASSSSSPKHSTWRCLCGRGEGSNYCATALPAAMLVGLPADTDTTLPPPLPLVDNAPPSLTIAAVASLRCHPSLSSASSAQSSATVLPTSFTCPSALLFLLSLSLLHILLYCTFQFN